MLKYCMMACMLHTNISRSISLTKSQKEGMVNSLNLETGMKRLPPSLRHKLKVRRMNTTSTSPSDKQQRRDQEICLLTYTEARARKRQVFIAESNVRSLSEAS